MARLLKPRAIPVAWVLAWSAAVMVAVAVPAGMLAADPLNVPFIELDSEWHRQVEQWRTPFLDGVNAVLNWFGYTGALTFHTALVAVLLLRRRPLAAAFATAAGLGALGITQLAKALVDRPRPADAVVFTDTASYPSGHVSATTALLMVAALLIGRLWMWLTAGFGVLSMMFSRTYLAAHWLTDTFAGAALAAVVVLLVWLVFQRVCVIENADAQRILAWLSRAERRRRAAGQAGSAPR